MKRIFLGQLGRSTLQEELLNSAPPDLQPALRDYLNHLQTINPIDCGKVMAELQTVRKVAEVAKDMNVLMGGVERCRAAASKWSAGIGPAAVLPGHVGFRAATPKQN